jgi:Zinc finger C-x8-C-x5-C-x3-H type (and similar)
MATPFVNYLDSSPTLSPWTAEGPSSMLQTVQVPDDLFQCDPLPRRTAVPIFLPSPPPSPSLRGRGHGHGQSESERESQDNARTRSQKHVSTADVGDSNHIGNGIRCCYFDKGRCNKGEECPFSYGDSHHVGNGIACRYFKKRSCTRGDRCLFSHVTVPRPATRHVSSGIALG